MKCKLTAAMPQAATTARPRPAYAREHSRAQQASARTRTAPTLEARTAILETRWEETVPTLATKADLSYLENRLTRWTLGAAITLVLGIGGLLVATNARIDQVNTRLDDLNARVDTRFEKIDTRFDKIDTRFDKIDARFEKIDQTLNMLIEEMRAQRQ